MAHPSKVHAFARASGHFAKTDKLDAQLLHKFGHVMLADYNDDDIRDEQNKQIISLARLARSVKNSLHAARCRLKQMPSNCGKYLEAEIALYQQ